MMTTDDMQIHLIYMDQKRHVGTNLENTGRKHKPLYKIKVGGHIIAVLTVTCQMEMA